MNENREEMRNDDNNQRKVNIILIIIIIIILLLLLRSCMAEQIGGKRHGGNNDGTTVTDIFNLDCPTSDTCKYRKGKGFIINDIDKYNEDAANKGKRAWWDIIGKYKDAKAREDAKKKAEEDKKNKGNQGNDNGNGNKGGNGSNTGGNGNGNGNGGNGSGSGDNTGGTGETGNNEGDVVYEPGDIKWSGKENLDIFTNPLYNDQKIIAPGSHNIYRFEISNQSDKNLKYRVKFEEINLSNINMKYRLKKGDTYVIGDDTNWAGANELAINPISLSARDKDVYYLEWKWFDAANDTEIGSDFNSAYTLKLFLEGGE